MKFFVVAATLFLSVFAQARQYTQCSLENDEGLYAVVNLASREHGTLFLTPGVETDVRMLAKIAYRGEEGDNYVFEVIDAPFRGELLIPANIYGSMSNNVRITLYQGSLPYVFSCFARYYEE